MYRRAPTGYAGSVDDDRDDDRATDPAARGRAPATVVPALGVDHATGAAALLGQLDRFVDAVDAARDIDLLAASRCHGWAAVDVVVHVRVGLQEMVGGVVAGTDRPADQDAATYWADHRPPDRGDDDVDAILWTRRTSSAYRRPRHALEHLRMAADTVRAAVAAAAPGRVAFQGHVLGHR